MCKQEKLRLILVDLLIRLLAQVTCKYKVTIVIYFWHDLVVNTISII